MYFQVQSPPPIWISRAVNPHSREIFQHAFCPGGADFFWNNPIAAWLEPCMFCEGSLDLELSRNRLVHEFYHLKVLITLEQVNTPVVKKKKNVNDQNFDQ